MSQTAGTSTELLSFAGLSHVLLDIEGTTCPVNFVTDTLFPYASARLGEFLERHSNEPTILALIAEVEEAWQREEDPRGQALRTRASASASVLGYLQWLIQQDRKLTPLKELQGMVWSEGYADGELIGPLFSDVPSALQQWQASGLILAVYSSGSVAAQQLLYGHSNAGDLRPLFRHWFDTRAGAKQNPQSYRDIADAMKAKPQRILFLSDTLGELGAAATAGLQVVFSNRDGNPQRDPGRFPSVGCFAKLQLT